MINEMGHSPVLLKDGSLWKGPTLFAAFPPSEQSVLTEAMQVILSPINNALTVCFREFTTPKQNFHIWKHNINKTWEGFSWALILCLYSLKSVLLQQVGTSHRWHQYILKGRSLQVAISSHARSFWLHNEWDVQLAWGNRWPGSTASWVDWLGSSSRK